ncbi:MAG: molybdenum cofactor biosynthesis protein MoaE [Ilumatobacteraceae bacterium]
MGSSCIGPAGLQLGESSVLVVVSSPHRPEAFEAGRFGIDALKASAPIYEARDVGRRRGLRDRRPAVDLPGER